MKTLLLFLSLVVAASAAPQTRSFEGTMTNITGEAVAPGRLELTQEGRKLTARLVTLPPLTGTGTLVGVCIDGWCDLRGSLEGGFTVVFRGVINSKNFRGSYVVIPTQGRTQYGKFEFTPAGAAVESPVLKVR